MLFLWVNGKKTGGGWVGGRKENEKSVFLPSIPCTLRTPSSPASARFLFTSPHSPSRERCFPKIREASAEERGLKFSVLDSGSSSPGLSSGRGTALCSWARLFTLTMLLFTQVYKWVPRNLMLGVTLRWTCIPSRGSRNTLSDGPLGLHADLTLTRPCNMSWALQYVPSFVRTSVLNCRSSTNEEDVQLDIFFVYQRPIANTRKLKDLSPDRSIPIVVQTMRKKVAEEQNRDTVESRYLGPSIFEHPRVQSNPY